MILIKQPTSRYSKIYEIKRTNCYATLTKALEVFLSEKD